MCDKIESKRKELMIKPEIRSKLILKKLKDFTISSYMKNQGNIFFKERKFTEALKSYNKSLSKSLNQECFHSLIYGNRSAVLYELGYYIECVKDIELALSEQHTRDLKNRLLIRKSKCHHILGKEDLAQELLAEVVNDMSNLSIKDKDKLKATTEEFFKKKFSNINEKKVFNYELKRNFSPNENIPSASNRLGLKEHEKRGRYVYAKDDIKPGETIIFENSFISTIDYKEDIKLFHCNHCLKRSYNLIPCDECDVLFCSEQCRTLANESTHRVECQLTTTLVEQFPDMDIIEILGLKLLIQESKQGSQIEEFIKRCHCIDATKIDLNIYLSNDYLRVHNLATNEDAREKADLDMRIKKTTIILQYLRLKQFFPDDNWIEEPFKANTLEIGLLLLRYIQAMSSNAHDITMFFSSPNNPVGKEVLIGGGLYPLCSMFNHSCDPHVVRNSINGTTIVVTAIKFINKDEEIFDNYGYHYALHTKKDRQFSLLKQYRFLCECKACIEDYPLYADLQLMSNQEIVMRTGAPDFGKGVIKKSTELIQTTVNAILIGDTSDIKQKLTLCYFHLLVFDRCIVPPRVEINILQETIKRMLCYLSNFTYLNDKESFPDV